MTKFFTSSSTVRIQNDQESRDTGLVSEIYHENSKLYRALGLEGLPNVPATRAVERDMANAFKTYPHAARTSLNQQYLNQPLTLFDGIRSRRTRREFANHPTTFSQLSTILAHSVGRTLKDQNSANYQFRAFPSAGALYPTEAYVISFDVDGLESGAYHFRPDTNELETMFVRDVREEFYGLCAYQEQVLAAGFAIVFSSVFDRVKLKYGERGYRYCILECGHAAQNVCLVAASLEMAVMTSGGFFDDDLNAWLGLDSVNEAAVYLALVGSLDPPNDD